ncbi:MAG: hypothetical protein Fur0018_18250 [Anaerolineales bacterium]
MMSLSFRNKVPTPIGEHHPIASASPYAAAFLYAPQAILVMTTEGKILDGNPKASLLFHTPLENLRTLTIEALLPGEHIKTLRNVMAVELTLSSVSLQIPMQSVQGAVFQSAITLIPFTAGAEIRLLAYIDDISERVNADRHFQNHKDLLDGTRYIANRLLSTKDWQGELPALLAHLGARMHASRVCIFRNHPAPPGTLPATAEQQVEWHDPAISEIGNFCQDEMLVYHNIGLQRWGEVLSTRKALYGTTDSFPIQEQPFLLQKSILSLSVIPIFIEQNWWGFLTIHDCRQERYWSQDDIESLQIIANMIGNAIQRQETEQRLWERQESIRILNEITISALEDTPIAETFAHLARELYQWLKADGCYISLWDEAHQRPVPIAAYGDMAEIYPRIRPEQGDGTLTKSILEAGQTIFIEDVQQSPLVSPRWVFNPRVHSVLGIPMQSGDLRLGAVMLGFYTPRVLEAGKRDLVEQAVRQISLVLTRGQLLNKTQRQLEELLTLQRVGAAITQALDETTMLREFIEIVGEAFYADNISVLLFDPQERALTIRCSYAEGDDAPVLENVSIPLSEGITGYVARSGLVYRSGNVHLDSRYLGLNENTVSEICIPIQSGLQILGVLNAESTEPDTFDDADERLLSTLADNLGTALMRLRLFTAEQERRHEAETLQEVSAALTASLDLEAVLRNILVLLHRVLPYDSASVVIISDDGNGARLMAQSGMMDDIRIIPPPDLLNQPHIRTLLEKRQPFLISDTQTYPQWMPITGTEYIRCWMGIPLVVKEKVIGWLNLDKKEAHFYDQKSVHLALAFANQSALALENARLYNELETSYLQTVLALARAMDARDSYTADHSKRLSNMASAIARYLGCDTDEIQAIEWAALLHDIGKIGVPDHILLKPGKLDPVEWEIMRRHPDIGAEIIAPVQRLARVVPIVRAHQEKFDGSGYPNHLKGEEIPLGARILAVVDSYSAITDERVYRKGRSHQEALDEIDRCNGTHFDPQVVAAFKVILRQGFAR